MENEIIKRFDKLILQLENKIKDSTTVLYLACPEIKDFILSELKALKEECVDSEIDSTLFHFNDGTVLNFEQLKGYNYKTSIIKKAFAKRGI